MEDFIGSLHQRGGAVDVLQRGQAQAGQTQQMLGLGQAPILPAGTQHGFQALVQQLLIALQLCQQAATGFQLLDTGQLIEASL